MADQFRDLDTGALLPSEDELRAKLAAGTYTDAQKRSTWIDYDARMRAAGKARYETDSKLAGAGRFGLSAGLNYGAGAAPGIVSAVSLLTAPLTAHSRDLSLSDAAAVNRAKLDGFLGANQSAQVTGRLGAAIAPTPTNAIGRFGYRALGGGALAASAAAEVNLGKVAAKQIAGALVGGAGAIGAINAAEAPGDLATGKREIGDVFADVIDQASNPVNVGLSLTLGGAAAVPRYASDPRVRDLIGRATHILGDRFVATPDMLRSPFSFMAGLVDTLAKTSAGRRVASSWMDRSFWNPMRETIDEIRTNYGVAGETGAATATDRGAKAVRDLLPTEESKGGLALARGRIGQAIGRSQTTVGADAFSRLSSVLQKLDERSNRVWGSEGANSAKFSAVKRGLMSALERSRAGEEAPIQVLENLRQRFGEIAGFENASAGGLKTMLADLSLRDIRDAKDIYSAIRRLEGSLDPSIDRSLKDIAKLRGHERALRQVANTANMGGDYELLRATFSQRNFARRWDSLQKLLPADRIQAIRGAYLANFIQDVELVRSYTPRREALAARAMEAQWSGRGNASYRAGVFDSILPGLRGRMKDLGDITDLVMRSGVGRAEGSATFPRDDITAVTNASTESVGQATGLINDPGSHRVISVLLGAAGRLSLAETIINGRLARFLVKTSSGEAVYPNSVAGPALSRAGGGLDVAQALAQIGGSAVGGAAQAAQQGFGGARDLSQSLRGQPTGEPQ